MRRTFPADHGRDRRGPRRIAPLLFVVAGYLVLFYGLTNYFPLRHPRTIPILPFEEGIRLIPATCWVYLSYFALLAYSGARLWKCSWVGRACGAAAFVITASGIVFIVYPTTIVRPAVPGGDLSASVLRWVRSVDPPNNCFPSLHVGMAFCCSFLLMKADRREGIWVLLWAILVSASTLTTKQHYFLDVLGGVVVAILGFALFLGRPTASARRSAVGPGRAG